MEKRLEQEIGRLCREYAVCCVEVERREEANRLKRRVGELCGLGRENMDIGRPGMLQEVLDVVSGHLDGLVPSLEAVKLLAYCYYYVEEEECVVKALEILRELRGQEDHEAELAEVEKIVKEMI